MKQTEAIPAEKMGEKAEKNSKGVGKNGEHFENLEIFETEGAIETADSQQNSLNNNKNVNQQSDKIIIKLKSSSSKTPEELNQNIIDYQNGKFAGLEFNELQQKIQKIMATRQNGSTEFDKNSLLKILQEVISEQSHNSGKKLKDSENLEVDYVRMTRYILDKDTERNFDFYNCGLRAVFSDPYSGVTVEFINQLIYNWHKRVSQDPGKTPYKICFLDEAFLEEVEKKLLHRVHFLDIYSGKSNILLASRILLWLKNQGLDLLAQYYHIQIIGNLFEVGLADYHRKIAKNVKSDEYSLYSYSKGDYDQYQQFTDDVFYEQVLNIHDIYAKFEEDNQRFDKGTPDTNPEHPIRTLMDWATVYNQVLERSAMDFYRESDSQIILNFLMRCPERIKMNYRLKGFNLEEILPEDALHPRYTTKYQTVRQIFNPIDKTIELKRDVILRQFYPDLYFEYREKSPLYNLNFSKLAIPLDYPNPPKSESFCFSCNHVIHLVARHIPSMYLKYSSQRSVRPNVYLISQKTNRDRLARSKSTLQSHDASTDRKQDDGAQTTEGAIISNGNLGAGAGNNQNGNANANQLQQNIDIDPVINGIRMNDRNRLLLQAARRGNLHAINQLAQERYFGNVDQEVGQNRFDAIQYYERAANLGDQRAVANVGILKLQNARTNEELKEAIENLKEAAKKGVLASQNALAYCYESG